MRASHMHRSSALLVLIISGVLLLATAPSTPPMQAANPADAPQTKTEHRHSSGEEQAPNRAMQSIEGLVEATDPSLLEGAHIQASTQDGWVAAKAPIDALGHYHLHDLSPGQYTLAVVDHNGQNLTLRGDPAVELISDTLGSVLLRDLVVSAGLAPANTASVVSPQATGFGIINGTVRDSVSGQPVAGLEVSLYIAAGTARNYLTTAANGTYSFSNVAPGSYVVRFGKPSTGGTYLVQWYNGVPDRTTSTVIDITAGQTISNIDASLVRAGSISAWVDWSGSFSGPTSYILVAEAYDQTGQLVGEYSDPRYANEAMTPFVIGGLSTGSYRLKLAIRPYETYLRYISEYYNNRASLATADLISVVSNQQNYLGRITLSQGAILRGRVLGVGDSPLSGVSVRAYDTNGVEITRGYTDSSGTYILDDGLASGNYRLQFIPSTSAVEAKNYLPQYYLGKPDLASADVISVTAPLVTIADDVRLERMGEIRGTVTNASGQALAGVQVSIIDCAGSYHTFTTDAQGSYATGGLPSGSYNVLFTPSTSYNVEYYHDKPDSASADPVIVTNGVNTTADAVLDLGGQIGGRVADATTDAALANITVDVYRVGYGYITSTTTSSTGIYQTRSLTPGDYQLAFRPPRSGTSSAYISDYYPSLGTSPNITISGPGLIGDKHMALTRGGQITGRVLGADTSLPLEDISVTIYDQQGYWFDYTDVDAQGRFTTPGLPVGAYRLKFEPMGGGRSLSYARRYYGGADNLAATEAITVSGIGLITAQDTPLLRGGQLGGIVRSAVTQNPLNDAAVTIYDADGLYVDTTYTTTDGSYITGGLVPGEYRLRFSASTADAPVPCRFVYAPEYYNDKLTLDLADPIPIYGPTFTGGVDADLAITEALYSVYGYARDPFGAGISGVTVTALETGAVSTPSNADGFYRIDGLRTQNYTLRAGRLGYAFSSDQPIAVFFNRGPINFVGQPTVGYTISGIVRDHYGRPLANAIVRTRDLFTGVPAASLPTGTNGTFSIATIPPGTYELTATATDYTFAGVPITLGFQNQTGVVINGMPIRTPSRTPLIFVPGITGSYLDIVNDWNSVTDDINAWPGNSHEHPALSLDPHDPNARPDIYASDVIRSVARNVGLEKQIYQPLLNELTLPPNLRYTEYEQGSGAYARYQARTAGGCHVNQTTATLFVFPYDWRQSSVISAGKLRDYVRCIRKIYPGTRVDLLTHSMGGVVARRYMLEYANDDSVDRLITIAAPWLGAPKAINTLETGQFLDLQGMMYTNITDDALADLVQYFDGAHQLLPSPTYFALGGRPFGEGFWDIDQSGNWLPETYETAAKFNRMLDLRFPASLPGTKITSFHTSQQDEGSPGSQAFYIYGEQTTDSTIEKVTSVLLDRCKVVDTGIDVPVIDELENCDDSTRFIVKMGAGDGTVPVLSARRVGNGQNLNSSGTTIIKCVPDPGAKDETVDHNGLTTNEHVLQLVWELLQRQAPTKTACAVDQTASRLSVDSGIEQATSGSSPLIYAQLTNTPQIIVSDSHGASSADMGGGIGLLPEGVSLNTLDRYTKLLLFDATEPYTVTFRTNDQPVMIDVSQGNAESRTQATRYLDLNLPPNVTAQLTIVGDHTSELRYDSDGNGSYETLVPPSAAVSGADANDITPPDVSVGHTGPTDHPTLTISATDTGVGVRAIYYSFDGTTFKRYVSPLAIDPVTMPIVYAFADDKVANRSTTIVQPTTGITYVVMLPYIVNAAQP